MEFTDPMYYMILPANLHAHLVPGRYSSAPQSVLVDEDPANSQFA